MTIINFLLKLLEALPILDKWFEEMALTYAKVQRDKGNEEFTKAMGIATKNKDVSLLSSSLGDELD